MLCLCLPCRCWSHSSGPGSPMYSQKGAMCNQTHQLGEVQHNCGRTSGNYQNVAVSGVYMCLYVCACMGLLMLEKVWVAWPETICAQQLQEWDLRKRKIP